MRMVGAGSAVTECSVSGRPCARVSGVWASPIVELLLLGLRRWWCSVSCYLCLLRGCHLQWRYCLRRWRLIRGRWCVGLLGVVDHALVIGNRDRFVGDVAMRSTVGVSLDGSSVLLVGVGRGYGALKIIYVLAGQ